MAAPAQFAPDPAPCRPDHLLAVRARLTPPAGESSEEDRRACGAASRREAGRRAAEEHDPARAGPERAATAPRTAARSPPVAPRATAFPAGERRWRVRARWPVTRWRRDRRRAQRGSTRRAAPAQSRALRQSFSICSAATIKGPRLLPARIEGDEGQHVDGLRGTLHVRRQSRPRAADQQPAPALIRRPAGDSPGRLCGCATRSLPPPAPAPAPAAFGASAPR